MDRGSSPHVTARAKHATTPIRENVVVTNALSPSWNTIETAELRRSAGPAAYSRGRDYARHADGRIDAVDLVSDDTVRASATGSNGETYVVKARLVPGPRGETMHVAGSCTCPAAARSLICKHAVALALIASGKLDTEVTKPKRARTKSRSTVDPLEQLAELVDAAPRDALISELLEAATRDAVLCTALTARLARFRPGPIDASQFKSMLQQALRVSGHLHWRETTAWAETAATAIEALGDLVEAAPSDAVKLCEYAFNRLDAVYGRIDDSGGEITMLLHTIRPIHEAAVHNAGEDPVKLARRLYELETGTELGVVRDSYVVYADALGDTGRAEFRALAEHDWEELAFATDWHVDHDAWSRRRGARRVLEQIAREERDSERIVAIVGDELHHSHDYVAVVAALVDIEDLDGALEWAGHGLEANPGDTRITGKLIDVHAARGEHAEATHHAWTLFTHGSSSPTFDRLRETARAAGTWREVRANAFTYAAEHAPTRLAELHLADGDADAAWRAADEHGCSSHVRMEIARALEPTRGAEAASYYLTILDDTLEQASKSNYQQAVALLARADALLTTPTERVSFEDAIEELRTGRHRRKSSLMSMLDARGW